MLPDDHFGKFVTSTTLSIVLRNQALRWSSPLLFNDPFDMQFRFRICAPTRKIANQCVKEFEAILEFDLPLDSENPCYKLVQTMRGAIKAGTLTKRDAKAHISAFAEDVLSDNSKLLDKFKKLYDEHFQKTKLLCLTKSFGNILMWAHYADQHRGALLGFRAIDDESPWRTSRRVDYSLDVPELMTENELSKWITGQFSMGNPEFSKSIIAKLVYTKSVDWAYEEEFRIDSGNGRNPRDDYEDIRFSRDELGFVVLGCRFDPNEIEKTVRLLKKQYPYTSIFHATRSQSKFSLEFVEISAA